ncbi:MAG: 4Fe-4S binding protein [Candidatus Bathyarchaeota archaeon]|nr:MAG: 4Fe-4S binding protein [Candidatus Bathyarchaeota archaeon]
MPSDDYRNSSFYSDEDVQRIAEELKKAVTIPVNVKIESELKVYDFSEMKEILERARRIVVQDCGCKTEFKNCDAPRDVCISLDETADELLEDNKHNSRKVDVEEAIEVLQRSHEAGLVHMAYTMKGEEKPGLICSCCPCCCHTLGSLVRNGVHTQILASRYIAAYDRVKCIECGKCVERCVFQGRRKEGNKLVYDTSLCFGCGLCVSTCPMEAITLAPRNSVS